MATAAPRAVARPYRDFLTPALHRRFTSAALLTLALCYVDGFFMPAFDVFWTWFPIGPAGLRTLMIFMSILIVYVLRVAQLHGKYYQISERCYDADAVAVGSRNTQAPIQTFWRYAFTLDTFRTLGFYLASAWLFSEIFIWSQPTSANMAIIQQHEAFAEPSRLNERPIYVRTMFLVLAIQQAIWHLYHQYDRVCFPANKMKPASTTTGTSGVVDDIESTATPMARLKQAIPAILNRSLIRATATTFAGPIIYGLFLRRTVWHWTFSVASIMFTLPKHSKPTANVPFVLDVLVNFGLQSFLLIFLWEIANAAFSIYVAQAPLKKGLPLTNDSKDPNGSLIAGLKAKKDTPRSMAFWELTLIANNFEARRISIYKDLDRIGGSAWSQVLTVCLGELHAVVKRIQDFQNPPKAAAVSQEVFSDAPTMPKLAKPLQTGNVLAPSPRAAGLGSAVARGVTGVLRQNHPDAGVSPRKVLAYGKDRLLTSAHQEQLSPAHVQEKAQSFSLDFIRTPAGIPFRSTFARAAVCIVVGAPYGNVSPIVDAATALAKLANCSLKEDPYGKVHGDVATIIRTFTSTLGAIENLTKTLPVSWTDVEFKDTPEARQVAEINVILSALRSGLGSMINEFGEYQDSIGLTMAEMRKAKEAVARGSQQKS